MSNRMELALRFIESVNFQALTIFDDPYQTYHGYDNGNSLWNMSKLESDDFKNEIVSNEERKILGNISIHTYQWFDSKFNNVKRQMARYDLSMFKLVFQKLSKQQQNKSIVEIILDVMQTLEIPEVAIHRLVSNLNIDSNEERALEAPYITREDFKFCLVCLNDYSQYWWRALCSRLEAELNVLHSYLVTKLIVFCGRIISQLIRSSKQKGDAVSLEHSTTAAVIEKCQTAQPNKAVCLRLPSKQWIVDPDQIQKPPQLWRYIYVTDPYLFVFKDEVKLVVENPRAMRIIQRISEKIHNNCQKIMECDLKSRIDNFMRGSRIVDGKRINSFTNDLSWHVMRGTIDDKSFDFFIENMNTPFSLVLCSGRRFIQNFEETPIQKEMERRVINYLSSHDVVLEKNALHSISSRLLYFSTLLAIDCFSFYYYISQDNGRTEVIGLKRGHQLMHESAYDVIPNVDRHFISLNRLLSFTKAMLQRSDYFSSLWFDVPNSPRTQLLGHVFDYKLISCFSISAKDYLTEWFESLQLRMRKMIESNHIKKVADEIFPLTEQRSLTIQNNEIPTAFGEQIKGLLSRLLRDLLNDSVFMFFDQKWESYVHEMIGWKDGYLLNLNKLPEVIHNLNIHTHNGLRDLLYMGVDNNVEVSRFQYCLAQILRFVLKLAAHTLRYVLNIKVALKNIETIEYSGLLESYTPSMDKIRRTRSPPHELENQLKRSDTINQNKYYDNHKIPQDTWKEFAQVMVEGGLNTQQIH